MQSLYPLPKYCCIILLLSFIGMSAAWAQPTFTSVPANNATGVSQSANIVLTFNEAIRDGAMGNADLDDTNIDSHITLKLTNSGGSDIAFDATIDAANLIVTINPTGNLPSEAVIYVAIGNVENSSNDKINPDPTSFTFTVIDYVAPTPTFSPLGGAVNVAVNSNIVISFNENILNASGAALDAAAIEGGVVELKVTNNAGAAVPFTATFNGTNQITIDPDADLNNNTTYYVELNPVEDAAGNETVSTSITFTTPDTVAPTITFNPLNNATGVVETTNITITFNEPVRLINNSTITGPDISSLVELRLTDGTGALIPFSGSINGGNTVITINPTPTLAGNTVYYVEINPVEDFNNNATTIASITFTTGDTLPPSLIFNPANSATNVSAVGNITITFSEPIRKTDGSALSIADIEGGVVELKETNNSGTAVSFTATLSGGNTIITLNPSSTLIYNQVYYVEVNPIEDNVGNESTAQSITFTTENRPNISGFTPAGGTCIGDNVTVNGSRFTGTGSPASGNTQPTVTVNGVTLLPANIVSYNATQVVFTVPVGATSGPITIHNNDSDLTSANSGTLNIFPAIITSLPVIPETFNPAQNTNVDVDIQTTQDNNYSYAMILTAAPGGFSSVPPKTVHTSSGNSGTLTLNTSEGTDPDLNVIGDYTFRIDVSRTGCTTKTLNNTPFTLTVASLTVSASATSTTVCNGDKIILIGSVSGGTGFYQFKWTSNPAGFNSTASSPEVTPTANIQYILEVTDNSNNVETDFVDIVVNPKPTVTFVPAPLESTVRTNYTLENKDYQLYSSQPSGVFTGAGVTLKNDGFYYFNPFNAGVGSHNITLTYTDVSGCQDTDVKTFSVSNSVVDGLEGYYCKNRTIDSNLKLNVNAITNPALQFTRIRFYYNGIYYDLPQSPAVVGTPPTSGMPLGASYPLTITAVKSVTDIQTLLSTNIPDTYSLNIQNIINGWGYGGFYLDVFAKNSLGTEQLVTWQYFRVVDNQIAPIIEGLPKENICSDTSPVTLTSSITSYVIEQFSINPSYSGSLTGTKSEIFNPGHSSLLNTGFNEDLLTIQMNYKDLNNCPASVTSNINWVSKPKGPIANDVEFCQVVDGVASTYTIKGEPNPSDLKSTPLWYDASAPNTVLDQVNWEFTAQGVTGLIPLVKTYLVQQEYKGCKGLTTSVDLEIKPAPGSAFIPPPVCQGKDFNLTGPIDTGLGQPYEKYEWNFGDLSSTQIVMNDPDITYNYVNVGIYDIRLTVTNTRGCQNSEIRSVNVGLNPKPNFTFKQVCEGDLTEFTGSADIGVEKYEWDFDDGITISKGNSNDALPPPHSGTYISPKHKFAEGSLNASGDYNVTVTSYTNIGCSSSLTKVVTILDTLIRSTINPYIMANEGGGNGLWRLEDEKGNSTWEFAQPTTPMMKEFTSPAWVTNADGFYVADEKSYVNSPCLNISNIERPIISLDLIFDTDKNIEGAVIEYSKDNGNNWLPLGAENSGLNWFNTSGFRIGNIGESSVGWSGKSSEDLNDNNEKDILVQARRALDNLPNLSQAERSKVRFRIAFATTEDAKDGFEGIGFNNLSISTRDRISLLEMFTNVNADNYTMNNNVFKAISIDEIAKIQYHVNYTSDNGGNDAIATANQVDPAARAAYYGIPMSDQYIPRTYVDGYSGGMLIEGNWAVTEFNKQSLRNAQYAIKIDSMKPDDNSYLKMKVSVEAKVDIPATRNHILHIAVVEKVVGANEFVLRKLVPDVNGHALPAMNQADIEIVIDSVQLEKNFVNVNNLALVAFVQDLNSREVFQATIQLKPGYLPELITGIESLGAEQISIYPNPASKQFRVELPAIVTNDVNVQLIDQVGRKHDGGFIRAGRNASTINVEHLSEGIYILEIGSSNSIIRKKVMVVMKN
jgi:methionine-rich copper-binding protein CopC